MGHVQDPPVSTNMISIVCMIYHMKVHMFGYNLGPKKFSKSKIHILTISEPISMKSAIVAGTLPLHPPSWGPWNSVSQPYYLQNYPNVKIRGQSRDGSLKNYTLLVY